MNINMFFEFPGILILIGVVLLIIAIIIGCIAFKKVDENEYTNVVNREVETYENEKIGTDLEQPLEQIKPEEYPNQNVINNITNVDNISNPQVIEENKIVDNQSLKKEEIKEVVVANNVSDTNDDIELL